MSAGSAPVLAIAGMHRSGTSMLAGLLSAAGLPLGERLLGASGSNPHGHHEDTDFVALHDRALAAQGTDWTLRDCGGLRAWPADVAEDADRLIAARAGAAARCSGRGWGWKDPRTTLFLDEWSARIPALHVVVAFRGAAQVAASLRRLRDPALVPRFRGAWPLRRLGLPMTRGGCMLRMWCRYNEAALAFAARHPQRCWFVDAGTMHASWRPLVERLRGAGFRLADIDPAAHIDRTLLRDHAPPDLALRACAPRVRRIAAQLREVSVGGTRPEGGSA